MYDAYQRYNPLVKQARALANRYLTPKRGPLTVSRKPYRSRASQESNLLVGFPTKASTYHKSITHNITASSQATRVLATQQVTNLARSPDNAINQRQRDMINLLGFDLVMEIRNLRTIPCQFRMAVISPKVSKIVPSIDFFEGSEGARGRDFSTTLNSMSFFDRPINPDLYNVLYTRKFTIGAKAGGTLYNGTLENVFRFTKYVKVNRQIRYEGDAVGDCVNPIFVVYWIDDYQNAADAPIVTNAANVSLKTVIRFKNP